MDEIIEAAVRNPSLSQDMGINPRAPGLREELKKTDPRTWWDYNKDGTLALGLGETLDVVRAALEKQRFDVRVEYMDTSWQCVTDRLVIFWVSVLGGLWVQVGFQT